MREGRADDGVAARAARTHLAAQAVHPAVPRAGAAVLQLAPRLRAEGDVLTSSISAENKMNSVLQCQKCCRVRDSTPLTLAPMALDLRGG